MTKLTINDTCAKLIKTGSLYSVGVKNDSISLHCVLGDKKNYPCSYYVINVRKYLDMCAIAIGREWLHSLRMRINSTETDIQ